MNEKSVRGILKEIANKKTDGESTVALAKDFREDYRKLFISSVDFGGYKFGGKCFNFLIGGILDNAVGFLFVKDKSDLPEMSERGIIMLREIGDGWYLYKTT